MEQGLDYDKLLLHSDPLVEALKREIELFHGGDQIEIAIQNCPNLTIADNRDRIETIAQEFENISYCEWGSWKFKKYFWNFQEFLKNFRKKVYHSKNVKFAKIKK